MYFWENFYRRLALEARERAAQAPSPSARAALEEAAAEWSELAEWVERQHEKGGMTSRVLFVLKVYEHREGLLPPAGGWGRTGP
jgi:hypothetical protein